jgi:hypothetical protein
MSLHPANSATPSMSFAVDEIALDELAVNEMAFDDLTPHRFTVTTYNSSCNWNSSCERHVFPVADF